MHEVVRQQIEARISLINTDITWEENAASQAARILSTSDERIKELTEVRAAWQEILDA